MADSRVSQDVMKMTGEELLRAVIDPRNPVEQAAALLSVDSPLQKIIQHQIEKDELEEAAIINAILNYIDNVNYRESIRKELADAFQKRFEKAQAEMAERNAEIRSSTEKLSSGSLPDREVGRKVTDEAPKTALLEEKIRTIEARIATLEVQREKLVKKWEEYKKEVTGDYLKQLVAEKIISTDEAKAMESVPPLDMVGMLHANPYLARELVLDKERRESQSKLDTTESKSSDDKKGITAESGISMSEVLTRGETALTQLRAFFQVIPEPEKEFNPKAFLKHRQERGYIKGYSVEERSKMRGKLPEVVKTPLDLRGLLEKGMAMIEEAAELSCNRAQQIASLIELKNELEGGKPLIKPGLTSKYQE